MIIFYENRITKLAGLCLLMVFLLSACKVDVDITVDGSGAGTVSSTFTTDMDLLYQQVKAQAEKARANGVVVETGANGPNRFIKTKGQFVRIEELNAASSDFIWSLQKDRTDQMQLNVRANTNSFGAPIPLSITVHMPGKILEATAGTDIDGNTARWEGMYATLSGRGLSIRSAASSFSVPAALVVVLLLLVAIGSTWGIAVFFQEQPALSTSRLSRFCDQCGTQPLPSARFCEECGAQLK
jgi:hypothetical protein